MGTKLSLGYEARQQFKAFHARKQRWACIVAHRRAGKTVSCIMDLIDAALRSNSPDARFAYISPTYAQSKDSVWLYLKRFTAAIPGVEQRESDLMVVFANGARVRLYGSDNYNRMRGIFLDGCVLDEYADMAPRAWPEVIRPALADRHGWAVFIGTPRGRNDFWRVHQHAEIDPEWFSLVLRASETGILPRVELDDMANMLTPEQYAQEFQCSFDAAILGSYFGRELTDAETAGRITSVPYDPAIPVHTAWDIGIGDSTAIWFFQIVLSELHVIDHYEASGFALGHYVDVLKSKPYQYGRDYLPHDAMARELGTGRSIFETMKALSGRHPWIVRKLSIMDGINATRVTLGRAWFDAANCHDGLEALRAYHAEFDERAKVFSDRPKHDWSSHCFHGDTLLLTRSGTCQIKDLPLTGEVLTPCGWRQYRNPRITLINAPLVEVVFSDGHTVRCTPDHLFLTDEGWKSASDLRKGSVIQSTLIPSISISMAACTAFGRVKNITHAAAKGFTEMCGSMPLASFQAALISTTGMEIPRTISQTSNVCRRTNIFPTHGTPDEEGCRLNTSVNWRDPGLLSGTSRRREGFGTDATQCERSPGQNGNERQSLVSFVRNLLMRLSGRTGTHPNTVPPTANQLLIERVTPRVERADVWDITVPGVECFSLANGAVVHNSADAARCMSLAWREIAPEKPKPKPRDSWDAAFNRDEETLRDWRVA